ncbi:MAG: polyprenyl diphosphate synthase [Gemmatimonadota bacterium]|nr:polyprenyl diphosphate synthase [Gemmatimonadota bacterium]MDQ8167203.1 polyprenyl diphosphate synthase [Gemmatimonadota bacterium]MDQ8172000.1 polyprenyl diphosphate synthase [Gemmatimonadota bacterium]
MTHVPSHLAVIMDGNGRWATRLGRPRWMGHVRGAHTAREVVAHCAQRGVAQLTLYAFSSDNWKRPAEEVGFLFDLFASHLEHQLAKLVTHGIRLSMIGRRDRLPKAFADAIAAAEARTAHGTRMHLRVAVDYSSRAAMQEAFAQAGAEGSPALGSPALGSPAVSGSLIPPVDLVLRTGGERRLSDFLLWESAYAELAFLDVNFPDLSTADLDAVFADYAARDRRFGGVPSTLSA